jgi:hypothetical protein
MHSALRCGKHVTLVLDRTCAKQHVPMRRAASPTWVMPSTPGTTQAM